MGKISKILGLECMFLGTKYCNVNPSDICYSNRAMRYYEPLGFSRPAGCLRVAMERKMKEAEDK